MILVLHMMWHSSRVCECADDIGAAHDVAQSGYKTPKFRCTFLLLALFVTFDHLTLWTGYTIEHNFSWRFTELPGDVSVLINQCCAVTSLEMLVFLMCLPIFHTTCMRLLRTLRHSAMKLYCTGSKCGNAVGGSVHLETERLNEGLAASRCRCQ